MRLGHCLALAAVTLAPNCLAGGDAVGIAEPVSHSLVVVHRHISQTNSRWFVRYQLRYDGGVDLALNAGDIALDYLATLANSACKPHAIPRRCELHLALADSTQAHSTVIAQSNDRARCRERLAIGFSTGTEPLDEPPSNKAAYLPLELSRGQVFWLYFNFEHDHFLYGAYDPLLGVRTIELTLGPARFRDTIELKSELNPARPRVRLSNPATERLDSHQFRTAPDSLYLAADIPGYQYFRFDDIPVRYGTPIRVSFWYLVAVGTEGTCHIRMMEYQDTPNAWQRLDGGFDSTLTGQGRWKRFEQTFTVRDDATTIALDFRILGANVGELWIDDMQVEALYGDSVRP